MTRYTLLVKPSAQKELNALNDKKLIGRLVAKIEALIANPRPAGCRKLQGFRDLWRVRVGDYRIVYAIDDGSRCIDVTRIAQRSEVYD
ncbi:MAG: type II toxin-antitoxin system RelE/ParE family toxin [Bryobacteraceae bacterium]|nr:type II toxin-antitoxin system RelE/ParE family toxin [Bryobacteraceae bacterium]